jgi:hypothetical protein
MAKGRKSAVLARLVEAIEIKNQDGTVTMVPVSAEANSIANKIMASQMRALMQKSIDKFMSIDHMTPKELKEFTEAARNIAEFSGEVYKAGEEVREPGEKKVESTSDEEVDFTSIKAQPKLDKPSEQKDKKETQEGKEEKVESNEVA